MSHGWVLTAAALLLSTVLCNRGTSCSSPVDRPAAVRADRPKLVRCASARGARTCRALRKAHSPAALRDRTVHGADDLGGCRAAAGNECDCDVDGALGGRREGHVAGDSEPQAAGSESLGAVQDVRIEEAVARAALLIDDGSCRDQEPANDLQARQQTVSTRRRYV